MSRGLGKTQRAILAYMETAPYWTDAHGSQWWRPWTCSEELATVIYGEATTAALVAVRRALRGLIRLGLVEYDGQWMGGGYSCRYLLPKRFADIAPGISTKRIEVSA